MSIEDDIAFIERVPTLRMLGRTALRILAIGAESRYVHQGEVLFSAGDPTDCGYVIQEGSFRLQSDVGSVEEVPPHRRIRQPPVRLLRVTAADQLPDEAPHHRSQAA